VKIAAFMLLAVVALRVDAQDNTTLALLRPAAGQLESGESQQWTFTARTGEPLSFVVETISGNLDPLLVIRDSSGDEVIRSDDVAYPTDLNPLLEAVSFPQLGTYTATLSSFGGTAGEFVLTMLPGYAQRAREEDFSDAASWASWNGSVVIDGTGEQLTLSPTGSLPGITFDGAAEQFADFFAQVNVIGVEGDAWAVGMTARHEGDSAYLYQVNAQGLWRFSVLTPAGETVIRDWERHPAVRQGTTAFTMGIMAMGVGFDLFYNGETIAQLVDDSLPMPGHTGLIIEGGTQRALFDDFIVTVPVEIEGAAVIPQQLVLADANLMTRNLKRQRLISASGQLAFTIAESFNDFAFAGISSFGLARDSMFTNFAFSAVVRIDSVTEGAAGCGLYFRAADESHYTLAYLNRLGEYGLSERAGDTFSPGLYGQNPAWIGEDPRHLLIIANAHTLHYYIDGRYVGAVESSPAAGAIGNAVVNFEPVSTTCRFNNLWLWHWN
jgi:hypothetical protein